MNRYHLPLLSLLSCAVLHTSALADTYVVDDDGGPGVDFTDIPAAISFASKGDVLLVQPGSYSSFNLQKGLTVLGSGSSTIAAAGVRIQNVPPSHTAVVADMRIQDMQISACDGSVIIDGVSTATHGGPSTRLDISNCIDVRLRRCVFHGNPTALRVDTSRVEVADSTLTGGDGDASDCGSAEDGHSGVVVNTSRIHFAAPDIIGGDGGNHEATCFSLCGGLAGDGGDGVRLTGSEVFVTGAVPDRITGGGNGIAWGCECDGDNAGNGAVLENTSMRFNPDILFAGQGVLCGSNGQDYVNNGGNNLHTPTFTEPTLRSSDLPRPGQTYTVTIHGEPSASARFYLGRFTDLTFHNPNQVERMTSEERVVSLGLIPASGKLTLNLSMPANVTPGFAFHAQVSVVQPNGFVQLSNSLPMIMR